MASSPGRHTEGRSGLAPGAYKGKSGLIPRPHRGKEWPHFHAGGRSGLISRPHGGKEWLCLGHARGRSGLIPGQCEGKGKLFLPPALPENKARVLVDQHLDGYSKSSQYDSIGTCTHIRY